ncbi:hypothetical protein Nepgr_026243 [Nepenthes gracilis]|uniref:Uncharacterized protein n=1 Tax=Nepenthes gracilis TaxID=150966 RepID=A0AAD3T7K0_NEPGR|nr:hypothetical protein Nepgr_026243 [Nepenthes gracilis]
MAQWSMAGLARVYAHLVPSAEYRMRVRVAFGAPGSYLSRLIDQERYSNLSHHRYHDVPWSPNAEIEATTTEAKAQMHRAATVETKATEVVEEGIGGLDPPSNRYAAQVSPDKAEQILASRSNGGFQNAAVKDILEMSDSGVIEYGAPGRCCRH